MKKDDIFSKRFLHIYYMLFAMGLFLSFWYAQHQVLRGDQFQMLQKGYIGAYTGYWISYGSSASAVGNVPGMLSSLLVGAPLRIIDSPWAPMLFLILLHAASFFLFDSVIKDTFRNNNIRLAFLVLYWLNPWFLFENKLYNISYLFFCSALHMWSAFRMKKGKSLYYSFCHFIAIGIAVQLHHSWVVLAVITSFLFYKRLIHINWAGFFFACFVILASLVPYFQEFLKNESIRHNAGTKSAESYIGWGGIHVYPVLKAVSYWFRYGSFYFTKHLISEANFDWTSLSIQYQNILSYLYKAVAYSIGLFTVWISLISNWAEYKKIRHLIWKKIQTGISDEEWVLLYSAGAFIALLATSFLSPIVFVHWHLMVIFPAAVFPVLVLAEKYYSRYFAAFFIPVTVYLLAVNVVTSIDSSRFDIGHNYKKQAIDFIASDQALKDSGDIQKLKQDIIFDPW